MIVRAGRGGERRWQVYQADVSAPPGAQALEGFQEAAYSVDGGYTTQ